MPRKMTSDERERFKDYFPGLDVERAMVSGERAIEYNCVSWTVGVTTYWLWPGSHIENFDKFYESHGYTRAPRGPIAVWGHGLSEIAHAGISGLGHGPRWESKCGSDLRIQHGLDELAGDSYGRVVAFYSRKKHVLEEAGAYYEPGSVSSLTRVQEVMGEKTEQNHALESVIRKIDEQTISEFEARFSTWAQTWRAHHTAHLSNPAFVKDSKEFVALMKMGTAIVPLIVQKLTNPRNFFALQLYDTLQPEVDKTAIVHIDPEDDAMLEGEQGRAARTVERWVSSL